MEECFPYVSVFCLVGGSGDAGGVPASCVDVERCEDPGLEWAAAGDEPDVAAGGGDRDLADTAKLT